MEEVTYKLDQCATDSIKDLMRFYRVYDSADVIKKGLALLKIAAYVEQTDGEMIVRKGNNETKIIIS